MSRMRMLGLGRSNLIRVMTAGYISYPVGFVVVSIAADDVNEVQAVATDRGGGVVRSVHRNDSLSYSITAIIWEDRLGRLRTLLPDQPDSRIAVVK